MEEKKMFTEKESLELISQMIQMTKENLERGSGNVFLIYGYAAVVLSVVVYAAVYITGRPLWNALWFLMFIPAIVMKVLQVRKKPSVVTHIDKMLAHTWCIVGSLFGLTVVAMLLIGMVIGSCNFGLMLPLCLLYAGIGTSITGLIVRVPTLVYSPLVAFLVAVYMLMVLTNGGRVAPEWNLYFGFSFLLMMVIPGHLLNKKAAAYAC